MARRFLSVAGLSLLAIAAGLAAPAWAAVTPLTNPMINEVWVYARTEDNLLCADAHEQNRFGTVARPLDPIKASTAASCSAFGISMTSSITVLSTWESAYAGSVTVTSRGNVAATPLHDADVTAAVDAKYGFTTDGPYILKIAYDSAGGGNACAGTCLVVKLDGVPLPIDGDYSGTSSIPVTVLPPGEGHILQIDSNLYHLVPRHGSGGATQNAVVKWRLEGCEDQPPVPVAPAGVGVGDTCPPAGEKHRWTDEQSEQFRFICDGASFHLRFHPDGGTAYTPTGQCPWGGGQNGGHVYSGGDSDADGLYDCFISSYWQSREPFRRDDEPWADDDCGPGICRERFPDQGAQSITDRCVYRFDVKTRNMATAHQVHEHAPGGGAYVWRAPTPAEMIDAHLVPCPLPPGQSLAAEALGGSFMTSDPFALCDLDLDGDCDTADSAHILQSLGACAGSAAYDLLFDPDADDCVTEVDLRAVFPALDFDQDGVPNAADDCVAAANPGQQDADGDGRGDACDCAPGANDLFAPPHEVRALTMLDAVNLTWDSDARYSGAATVYDAVRGMLEELPVGGPAETCLGSALSGTILHDDAVPELAPGGIARGFYYLVRGRNACGTSDYGRASAGTPRVSSVCP